MAPLPAIGGPLTRTAATLSYNYHKTATEAGYTPQTTTGAIGAELPSAKPVDAAGGFRTSAQRTAAGSPTPVRVPSVSRPIVHHPRPGAAICRVSAAGPGASSVWLDEWRPALSALIDGAYLTRIRGRRHTVTALPAAAAAESVRYSSSVPSPTSSAVRTVTGTLQTA